MTKFEASGITVLRFSYKPDRSGEIIPPECHIKFANPLWVVFDGGSGKDDVVGRARVRREGNLLLADLELVSHWDSESALAAISELRPAICGKILDAHEATILRLELHAISLGDGNADKLIQPLGGRLRIVGGKGLH
jgi:hypothetical protein